MKKFKSSVRSSQVLQSIAPLYFEKCASALQCFQFETPHLKEGIFQACLHLTLSKNIVILNVQISIAYNDLNH